MYSRCEHTLNPLTSADRGGISRSKLLRGRQHTGATTIARPRVARVAHPTQLLRRSSNAASVVVVERMERILVPEPAGIEFRCGRARAVYRIQNTCIANIHISIHCLTATDWKSRY